MRTMYKIVGGLLMACGAFMLLGFVIEVVKGELHSSLGIQLAVLLCSVLMPLLLGCMLLRKSLTPRIDIALALQSSVGSDRDARPNDNEADQAPYPGGASFEPSSSLVPSLGTDIRIRFSLTRVDLFKIRTAALMSSRPLQALLLLTACFCGFSGFTYESIAGESVAFRTFYAGCEIMFVLGVGFIAASLLNALHCFTGKARGVIGEHTLEVTDEGLIETTEYNTSLHRWSGFHKMKQSIGFLWIYVTDTMAHIIPINRPLQEGDLPAFVHQLRAKVNNAKVTSTH
jgi:hypothetical protein